MWFARRYDHHECRSLRRKGWLLSDLAARYGVTKSAISKACKGVVPMRETRPTLIPVPSWVPGHLRWEYRRAASRRGEEEAAARCRRLKAAAAASVWQESA